MPAASAPHCAALEQQAGPEAGRVWLIDREEVDIGRSMSNTIPLANPSVSGLHARVIRQANGACLLVDNQSTNGTKLNGHAVSGSAVLHDGDLIQIGGVVFIFHEAVPAPEPA